MTTFNVTWVYPDILNLHGDRGNVMALERLAELLKLNFKLTRVNFLHDSLPLESTDLLIFNAGEWKNVCIIADYFTGSTDIANYVQSGGSVFASGTSAALLGKELHSLNGAVTPGFGLLEYSAYEDRPIYGDDLFIDTDSTLEYIGNMRLVGNQIAVSRISSAKHIALGRAISGRGNADIPGTRVGVNVISSPGSSEGGVAGARPGESQGAVIGTNLIGPVLVKNPWFTQGVIALALARRGKCVPQLLPDSSFTLERSSFKRISEFNQNRLSMKVHS